MINIFKKMLYRRAGKKLKTETLLKQRGIKIVRQVETSLTLFCFGVLPSKKRGLVDLFDEHGNVLVSGIKKSKADAYMRKFQNVAAEKYPNLSKGKALSRYLDELVDVKNFRKRVDELFRNPKFIQPNRKKYHIKEVESAVGLERKFGGRVRASKKGEAGDFILEGGDLAGKSVDAMGLYKNPEIISDFNRNYGLELRVFKNSINKHFRKIEFPIPTDVNKAITAPLDFVAIDFRYMDDINPRLTQDILDYINNPTYIYSNYVNNNLIKLNL